MKRALLGVLLTGVLTASSLAQPPPLRGDRGGPLGLPDTGRRAEMLAERWAQDFSLNQDQKQALKDILDKAQTSARQPQDEITALSKAVKEAVQAGDSQPELDTLHKQIGEAHTKLAAIQSNAFADVLKLLKDDQKKNTDFVYETLGTLVGPVGRGAVMMRGGPGAMNRPGGPDSFVRPGGPDRQRGPDGRR